MIAMITKIKKLRVGRFLNRRLNAQRGFQLPLPLILWLGPVLSYRRTASSFRSFRRDNSFACSGLRHTRPKMLITNAWSGLCRTHHFLRRGKQQLLQQQHQLCVCREIRTELQNTSFIGEISAFVLCMSSTWRYFRMHCHFQIFCEFHSS